VMTCISLTGNRAHFRKPREIAGHRCYRTRCRGQSCVRPLLITPLQDDFRGRIDGYAIARGLAR
jgi:hypothetical protein